MVKCFLKNTLIVSVIALLLVGCSLFGTDKSPTTDDKFIQHYQFITQTAVDQYGRDTTKMWLSSWNLETGQYPFDFSHPDSIPCRVYLDRSVDAPGGATLYWSLPDIAACVDLSQKYGYKELEASARSYVKAYLERCTAKNGVILWGNHYYYDVISDHAVKFKSSESPRPVDFNNELGDLHELRPLLPPWELLFDWFPQEIENHIRKSSLKHVADYKTGEFNRHANQSSEYAFLESGSIIVNSLAFLYSKTEDNSLLELADLILRYSFDNRNPKTGLVINSPSKERWDQHTSTTEIGLWSLNILKARQYVPDSTGNQWLQMVEAAMEPWLINGFDEQANMYYGSLNVLTGEHIRKSNDYPYQPQTYADIWNPLFPTHNYPLQFAESCLLLSEITGKEIYKIGADRWIATIKSQLKSNIYAGPKYAENYARIIHFLNGYDQKYGDDWARSKAMELTKEAINLFYVDRLKMFKSHTDEMRYDCVDGVGLLFFAIKEMESKYSSDLKKPFF